jgi:hypothetical protein
VLGVNRRLSGNVSCQWPRPDHATALLIHLASPLIELDVAMDMQLGD